MRRLRMLMKWLLGTLGAVVLAIAFLYWRDNKRDEAFFSCMIQGEDRKTVEAGRNAHNLTSEELAAASNIFMDDCMQRRGHLFIGGTQASRCVVKRDPRCYELF